MTNASRRRTLFWRLGAALVSVQIIVTGLLAAYAWTRFKSFHYTQAAANLEHIGDLAGDLLAREADPAALQPLVDRIARRGDVRVTVVDASGTVLADSDEDPRVMDNHRLRPEIDAAFKFGEGQSHRYSRTVDERLIFAARIIPESGEESGPGSVVRVAASVASLDEQLAAVVRLIATATLLSLTLTIVVIMLVSRHLSRQVVELAGAAGRFASGDLSHRVSAPAGREFGALADALNDMAEQLDQKLSELQKQRSEQHAILRSMSSGMIALDLDQRVLSLNRAAENLLRIDGSTARGRLLLDVVREPGLADFVEEALSHDEPRQRAFDLETGKRAAVQVGSELLLNVDGRQTGLLVFLDDVTQLRRLERIRSDFAANVSHELRTPITTIRGYIETLLEVGCDDDEQTAHFLGAAHRSTIRLGAIIEDLLALARLEQAGSRTAAADGEVIAVETIVQSACRDHVRAAAEREITIEILATPGLCVRGVPQLLEQAVGNLLANAIVYSAPGTTIRIETGRDPSSPESMIRLTVRDEGPGIAAEHLPRLFERFYRVDKARSRASGGTGLGLAIVKHICIVHGGRPEVESRVGEGSRFHVILPLAN